MDDLGKLIQSLLPLILFVFWFFGTAGARKKKKRQREEHEALRRRRLQEERERAAPGESETAEDDEEEDLKYTGLDDEVFDRLGTPRSEGNTPDEPEGGAATSEPEGGEVTSELSDDDSAGEWGASKEKRPEISRPAPEQGEIPKTPVPIPQTTAFTEDREKTAEYVYADSIISRGEIGGGEDVFARTDETPAVSAGKITELQKAVVWMEILSRPVSER